MFNSILEKLGFWPNDLKNQLKSKKDWIWFHAVSVGELNAIYPLVTKLKKIKAKYPILISCTTKAGYMHAKALTKNSDIVLIYFPFDIPSVLKSLFNLIKVKLLLIAETEIWPNILSECKKREIPAVLINGRLSDNSFKNYHFFRFYFKNVINNFSEILTQTEKDAEKYEKLGAPKNKVKTLGNLKFYTNDDSLQKDEHQIDNKLTNIIFASTHDGEESIALESHKELLKSHKNIRLIIAPRHITRVPNLVKLINNHGLTVTLRSEGTKNMDPNNILLLDTIGELKYLFKYCPITIMGGTFSKIGGHNILEPIRAKSYTIIGPYDFKIKEITAAFENKKALVKVKDKKELILKIEEALKNTDLMKKAADNGASLIKENENIIEKYTEQISKYL